MRRYMYGLLSAVFVTASPALAQVVVSEDTSDPIETATIDAGAPSDVEIESGVTVEPTDGTAVTINSSNTVINSGTIQVQDADNATGVRVLGGNTGGLTNLGSISIIEDFTPEDVDGDGDFDVTDGTGPSGRAIGSGRTGILVEGASPFVGDITNAGSITVEGNESAGVRILSDLEGSFNSSFTDESDATSRGAISIIGDDSVGVDIQGNVSGDVEIANVTARGANTDGVNISGDVDGGVIFEGSTSATAFRETSRRPTNELIARLDEDDLLSGGSAAVISGDVAGGVFVSGATTEETDEDDDGAIDLPPTAVLQTFGDAPALLISANEDEETNSIAIGAAPQGDGHGLVVRGVVQGIGVNDDIDANGVQIEGNASESVDLAAGIDVGPVGSISASTFSGDATALSIGDNVSAPELSIGGTNQFSGNGQRVVGRVSATVNTPARTEDPEGDPTPEAVALDIAETATMNRIVNDGNITASIGGFFDEGDPEDEFDDEFVARGDAYAIRDASGSLTEIQNRGTIAATTRDSLDRIITAGDSDVRVAADLSNATADILFEQLRRETEEIDNTTEEDPDAEPTYLVAQVPNVIGDVLFGSGNDTLDVQAGAVFGDIAFGDGADTLNVDGGTYVNSAGEITDEDVVIVGALTDSDGQLAINVVDGRLQITNPEQIDLTSLNVGSEGELVLEINATDTDAVINTLLAASGGATFESGAQLSTNISGLIVNSISVPVVSSSSLVVDGEVNDLYDQSSFLYTANLSVNENDPNTLILNLRRLTAEELGMDAAQAAAYDPLAFAAAGDDELASILAMASNEDEFFGVYNQLLPDFSDATLQFAIAFHDIATGAVGNRLDAVREGRESAGSIWVQETATFLDRESVAANPGYRGYGLGFSAGIDRPLGPLYAVGLTMGGFSSQYESPTGFDEPLIYESFTLGLYAATELGPLLFDAHYGGGFDKYESERVVRTSSVIEGTSFARRALADWSGTHQVGGARVSAPFSIGAFRVTPAVSADYIRIDEEGYQETGGGGLNISREDRLSELGSATATLDIGARFVNRIRGSWWQPQIRVGYREELFSTLGQTVAQSASGDPFVLDVTAELESGATAGFSLAAGSEYSSFALNYDAVIREGFTRHTGRATFRLQF